MTKTCTECGHEKQLTEFYKRSDKEGHRAHCKTCHKHKASTKWRGDVEFRARQYTRSRRANLKKMYGITPENYVEMYDAQDGKCAICGTTEPGRGAQWFCIDHCHDSGIVRGLLCNNCNTGLGAFKDNPDALLSAIDYLNEISLRHRD